MTVVVFDEDVLRFICWYAPQCGRSLEEKQSLYDELKYEWDMHSADGLVMCLGDINGHIGRPIYGFNGANVGHGIGQVNLEGRMLLDFCLRRNYVCQIHGLRERKRGR